MDHKQTIIDSWVTNLDKTKLIGRDCIDKVAHNHLGQHGKANDIVN